MVEGDDADNDDTDDDDIAASGEEEEEEEESEEEEEERTKKKNKKKKKKNKKKKKKKQLLFITDDEERTNCVWCEYTEQWRDLYMPQIFGRPVHVAKGENPTLTEDPAKRHRKHSKGWNVEPQNPNLFRYSSALGERMQFQVNFDGDEATELHSLGNFFLFVFFSAVVVLCVCVSILLFLCFVFFHVLCVHSCVCISRMDHSAEPVERAQHGAEHHLRQDA